MRRVEEVDVVAVDASFRGVNNLPSLTRVHVCCCPSLSTLMTPMIVMMSCTDDKNHPKTSVVLRPGIKGSFSNLLVKWVEKRVMMALIIAGWEAKFRWVLCLLELSTITTSGTVMLSISFSLSRSPTRPGLTRANMGYAAGDNFLVVM
jgi:hypothetical protein